MKKERHRRRSKPQNGKGRTREFNRLNETTSIQKNAYSAGIHSLMSYLRSYLDGVTHSSASSYYHEAEYY